MLEKAKELFKVGLSLFSATLMLSTVPVLAKTDNMVGETVQKSTEQVRVQQSLQSVENALRVQNQDLGGKQTQKTVDNSVAVTKNVEAERGLELALPSVAPTKVEEKRSEVSDMITTLHVSGTENQSVDGSQSVTKEERTVIQQNFVNGIQTANDEYKAARTQALETRKAAVLNAIPKTTKKSTLDSFQNSLESLRVTMQDVKQNLVDGIRTMLGNL